MSNDRFWQIWTDMQDDPHSEYCCTTDFSFEAYNFVFAIALYEFVLLWRYMLVDSQDTLVRQEGCNGIRKLLLA